ncbi:enoyl-CoA hydratase [Bacillus sp. B15-48]|nr:enoyl-CoA hydratase [Bacillus sp. B15-48]
MTNNTDIEIKKKNGICLLTLNKPEVRNALGVELRITLTELFKEIDKDDSIKVVILTGNGPVFSAGGDLTTLREQRLIEGRKRILTGHELIRLMLKLEKPIIAAVNGPAAGAGMSLALACDFIIASERASFISSFSKVALVPDLGSAFFLSQILGPYFAKKIMMTGEPITAQKAFELQMVNEVVAEEQLMKTAYSFAEQLACGPGISNGLTKMLVNRSMYGNLDDVLEYEAFSQAMCFETQDFIEGVDAFFNKRPAKFQGK